MTLCLYESLLGQSVVITVDLTLSLYTKSHPLLFVQMPFSKVTMIDTCQWKVSMGLRYSCQSCELL